MKKNDRVSEYLLSIFFTNFLNNTFLVSLMEINFLDIFNIFDFFQIFFTFLESNFLLGMYGLYMLNVFELLNENLPILFVDKENRAREEAEERAARESQSSAQDERDYSEDQLT